MEYMDRFRIEEKVCIITGGAGLIGRKHAEAALEGGGIPVLLDISETALTNARNILQNEYPERVIEVLKRILQIKKIWKVLRIYCWKNTVM